MIYKFNSVCNLYHLRGSTIALTPISWFWYHQFLKFCYQLLRKALFHSRLVFFCPSGVIMIPRPNTQTHFGMALRMLLASVFERHFGTIAFDGIDFDILEYIMRFSGVHIPIG